MLSTKELERLYSVLEEAQRTDTGNHFLPDRYTQDLRESIAAVKRELSELSSGFFVDWDGNTRRVGTPGEGLECEVRHKGSHIGVEVLASDGSVVHEAIYYPNLVTAKAAGVNVKLI